MDRPQRPVAAKARQLDSLFDSRQLDLSFSVWFFYLFAKGQRIIASIVGWRSLPGFPYFNQQTTGGWLALFLIALWLTRRHLMAVLGQALRFQKTALENR